MLEILDDRYGFYQSDGKPLASNIREQILLLETPQLVPTDVIEYYRSFAPKERRRMSSRVKSVKASSSNGNESPLDEQLKATILVREFVSHYVQLSQSGTGLCPLHNDYVDSFSVDDKRNFWYCFACETGGSIIDFWTHHRDCDFRTAVDQLGMMLL